MKFFAISLVITVILSACGEAQVTLQPTTVCSCTNTLSTLKPTATTLRPVAQNIYCNIATCSVPSENTLCKYTNSTWGAACLPSYPTKSSVSAEEIDIILQTHNDYRRKVAKSLETSGIPGPQPSASNIRQLVRRNSLYFFTVKTDMHFLGIKKKNLIILKCVGQRNPSF
ncbi:venom allergen 5 2-like [Daphnia carinata]|uniref:venom allergen 5 2-like n=1 Tax=Daphnia carinata TaxID=120202 RepID=UPI002868641B|nr:venom allergen 5 2-like [Daphnia carinata]